MNVEKNPAKGEDANYYEQEESQGDFPNNQLGLMASAQPTIEAIKTTYSSVTRPKPKVFEFKLKSSDNADVLKLTEAELSKVVVWATTAAKVKAIFQRGDKVEVKFGEHFNHDQIKLLGELVINNRTKINSFKETGTLVTLNRVPLQVDDNEITNYLGKFGALKGPVRRKTYAEGPLKGLENGSITALMVLTQPIPSYHLLKGKRFEAYYKGMTKTCYWCLKSGDECHGVIKGNGNSCRLAGAQRGNHKDYISNLWEEIGWKNEEEEATSKQQLSDNSNEAVNNSISSTHVNSESSSQLISEENPVNVTEPQLLNNSLEDKQQSEDTPLFCVLERMTSPEPNPLDEENWPIPSPAQTRRKNSPSPNSLKNTKAGRSSSNPNQQL